MNTREEVQRSARRAARKDHHERVIAYAAHENGEITARDRDLNDPFRHPNLEAITEERARWAVAHIAGEQDPELCAIWIRAYEEVAPTTARNRLASLRELDYWQ
jgi:hypothetical protein